jgi:Protein of unknown function (DUF3618)
MTDPEQLKEEIAQTRSDLAETVDELSHRMDPREQLRRPRRLAATRCKLTVGNSRSLPR